MSDTGRMKKPHIQLKESERTTLQEVLSQKKVSARVLKRAMALLALDRGETLEAVAGHQQVTNDTIARLRNRYGKQGLGCLQDAPRTGRPIEIDGSQRAQITALACSKAPEGHSQWSLRLLSERIVEHAYCESISHTQVQNILKKTQSSRI